MNKTKIEWCDETWNPVTGCLHTCEYCYARRIAERFGGCDNPITGRELKHPMTITRRDGKAVVASFPFGFEPTLHRYRLGQPARKKAQRIIFVCSMADLFGAWVPDEWIAEVFAACRKAPQHRYLFLTKNPARYMELASNGLLPEDGNFWYGFTATRPDGQFWWSEHHNTFVSIEPMLEEFPFAGDDAIKKVDWVIMGAMTGPGSKDHQPRREWVEALAADAKSAGVPVLMKESLRPIMGDTGMLSQFPWEVARHG